MVIYPDLEGTTLSPSLPENHTTTQLHTREVSSTARQQSLSNVSFCIHESTKYSILSPEKVLELKKKIEELSRRIQNLEFRRCREEGIQHLISEGCTDEVKEFTISEQEEQPHGDRVSQLEDLKDQLQTTQIRFLEHIAAVLRREYVDSHLLRKEVPINYGVLEHESTNRKERPLTGYDDPCTPKLDGEPCSEMATSSKHEGNDALEGPHGKPKENEGDSNYTRTPSKTPGDVNGHLNNSISRVEVPNRNEPARLALTRDTAVTELPQNQIQYIDSSLATVQDEESRTNQRYSTKEDSDRLVFNEEISSSSEGDSSNEDMSFTDDGNVVFENDAFENDSSDDGEANKSVTNAESEYESSIQDTGNNDGKFLSNSTGTSDFRTHSLGRLTSGLKNALDEVQDLKRRIRLNKNSSQQRRDITKHDIQGLEGILEETFKQLVELGMNYQLMEKLDLARPRIEPFDAEIVENKSQDAQINRANPVLLTQTSTKDTCDPERELAPGEAVQHKAGNESSLGNIIAGLTTAAAAAKTLQGFVDRFCAEKLNQICANGCKEELYIKDELDSLVEVLDVVSKCN